MKRLSAMLVATAILAVACAGTPTEPASDVSLIGDGVVPATEDRQPDNGSAPSPSTTADPTAAEGPIADPANELRIVGLLGQWCALVSGASTDGAPVEVTRGIVSLDLSAPAIVVEVSDVFAGRAGTGSRVYPLGDRLTTDFLSETMAGRTQDVIGLVITIDSRVEFILELESDGLRFKEPEPGTVPLSRQNSWILSAINDGVSVESLTPIDPSRSLYCQPLGIQHRELDISGPDIVAKWVEYAIAAHAGRQELKAFKTLSARADEVASETTYERDAVTGRSSSAWNTDVMVQAALGIPEADWVLTRTVPVLVDPGSFAWRNAAAGSTLVFAESATQRILGWFGYPGATQDSNDGEVDILNIMAPQEGRSVELYLTSSSSPPGCFEGVGAPYITIDYDDFAGSGRASLDMDKRVVRDWDGAIVEGNE